MGDIACGRLHDSYDFSLERSTSYLEFTWNFDDLGNGVIIYGEATLSICADNPSPASPPFSCEQPWNMT